MKYLEKRNLLDYKKEYYEKNKKKILEQQKKYRQHRKEEEEIIINKVGRPPIPLVCDENCFECKYDDCILTDRELIRQMRQPKKRRKTNES